jgi:hypothetical protein
MSARLHARFLSQRGASARHYLSDLVIGHAERVGREIAEEPEGPKGPQDFPDGIDVETMGAPRFL